MTSETGELSSSSSDLEVRRIVDETAPERQVRSVPLERGSPKPAVPKVPQSIDPRPDPRSDVPGVDAQNLESGSLEDQVTQEATTTQSSILEGTEQKKYKVRMQLDADEDAEFRLLTLSGEVETTLRVHRSRRIYELLMIAWKPGFCLKDLERYLPGESRALTRLPVSTRDQLIRTMIGSVIEATFVEDSECPAVQINYPLIRTVLSHAQDTESSCRRCDPLKPAWLFFAQHVVSVAFILDRNMRLRTIPTGTLLKDALRQLGSPNHSLVGLCRSMMHWTGVPRHYRAQPAMCLWVWPVPET